MSLCTYSFKELLDFYGKIREILDVLAEGGGRKVGAEEEQLGCQSRRIEVIQGQDFFCLLAAFKSLHNTLKQQPVLKVAYFIAVSDILNHFDNGLSQVNGLVVDQSLLGDIEAK